MGVLNHNVLAGASGQGSSGFEISRSLRFNKEDSAYLGRTFGSGNQRKWTFSCWVKRNKVTTSYDTILSSSTDPIALDGTNLYFLGDQLYFDAFSTTSLTFRLKTFPRFRDYSAWYHIVAVFDSDNSTEDDRAILYVNGVRIPQGDLATNTKPASGLSPNFNNAKVHAIGRRGSYGASPYNGANITLAETYFVDGQALAASDFGKTDDNGVWQPKEEVTVPTSINDGTIWSNSTDSALGNYHGVTGIFDNSLSTRGGDTNTAYLTYVDNATITASTGIRVYWNGIGAGQRYIRINGTTEIDNGSSGMVGWSPLSSYSGTINKIEIKTANTGSFGISAIEIDGEILIDNYNNSTGYGTNGFYLKFDDNSSNSALGTDSSGSSNTWTVNNMTAAVSGAGMESVIYTGNASSQAITGVGFQPDLVWLKRRDSAGNHNIQDVVRGASAVLQSDGNGAEFTNGARLASFDSDGFTLTSDNGGNASGGTYVAWCWKAGGSASSNSNGTITSSVSANNTYGFSIVSYTGNGTSGATIGHGLNAAPKFIIIKNRSDAENWFVWHNSYSSPSVNGAYLDLTANVQNFGGTSFNSTLPSSSVITLGNANIVNGSSDNMIAYCWSEVSGFSKFGSYTGNGSSTGPVVNVGFKPRYVMVKRTDANNNWTILDSARSLNNDLKANTSEAEASAPFIFSNTGFQPNNTYASTNASGGTYIYAAFAETPEASAIDSLIDTPTNYDDGTNVGGNYCVMNPLDMKSNVATQNGNLEVSNATTGWSGIRGTLGVSSGKWYYELQTETASIFAGIATAGVDIFANAPQDSTSVLDDGALIYCDDGKYLLDQGGSSNRQNYGSALANGDILGVAFDLDGNTVQFYKNGSALGSINISSSPLASNTVFPYYISYYPSTSTFFNFGQRPFAYTPPTGYKSLCTTNLPDPTIADGSTAFDTKLWTGDGTTSRAITGLNLSPDFLWIKSRSAAGWHALADNVRGAGKILASNATNSEYNNSDSQTAIESFDSNGFTIGHQSGWVVNSSSTTIVGWAWDGGTSTVSNTDGSITSSVRANASTGFSIVTGTQNSNNTLNTFGHGLGAEPHMVILKRRDGAEDWYVYLKELGNTSRVQLNSTSAVTTGSGVWGSTTPTSSVFTIQSFNAGDFVAYCFAPVEGYSAFGSYTGNGAADGPFVYTGFRSRWVMIKKTDSAGNWGIYDTSRDLFNVQEQTLAADGSAAESTDANKIDITSTGFKVRASNANVNTSGGTYIYAAFAEHPFKTARAR